MKFLVVTILMKVVLMKVSLMNVVLMKVSLMKISLMKVNLMKVILMKVNPTKVSLMKVNLMKVSQMKVSLMKISLMKAVKALKKTLVTQRLSFQMVGFLKLEYLFPSLQAINKRNTQINQIMELMHVVVNGICKMVYVLQCIVKMI